MNQQELIDAYLAGVEALTQAVRGLTSAEIRARPIPGTWSRLEVLCHLADSETLFSERMKRVLVEDRPALPFMDPERSSEREAAEEVAVITSIRRQMARVLRAQPAASWQRVGIHSKEGERSLEQLVQKAVDHLQHHLNFILAKRQALKLRP